MNIHNGYSEPLSIRIQNPRAINTDLPDEQVENQDCYIKTRWIITHSNPSYAINKRFSCIVSHMLAVQT